jgi:HD superfamily phosphohydrolase
MSFRKIINDPVYGFITIDDELVHRILAHPYYQRLRRIHQMAMAHLVYPGAVHTRLHHSLGAYHLMGNAINELRSKHFDISPAEEQAAKIAILLHDIGHGPYSHALEQVLIMNVHHEEISLLLIRDLNRQFDGQLQMALDVFTDNYPKKFLHQLISGQLDVDRMDYLTRDSFFTGVSEGVIGYDRILKMLTVHDGELVVEEKAIYSIEKFLVARRLMYWQVYLHKTVLCAEQMLHRIIKRARILKQMSPSASLNIFLQEGKVDIQPHLADFCSLDDNDIISAIKHWSNNDDKILAILCKGILNRELLKVKYSAEPVAPKLLNEKLEAAAARYDISREDAHWLVFTGEAVSSTYNFDNERICILFKDGTVKDISEVDNALIHENLRGKIKKYYICYTR